MPLRVKLRSSGRRLTPYVSQVQTSGRVQKAFKAQIGEPVGACVRASVKKGMSVTAIKKAVRDCAKPTAGTKLAL